ncbi:MAG: GNAT family N-acetyltransferase, partial [Pseudomonadota bacterium]
MPASAAEDGFTRGWVPGVIGEVTALHGRVYSAEWRFDVQFEVYVAAGMAEFMARYDPARDVILSAWDGGRLTGTITIDGSNPTHEQGVSKLRWFVVAAAERGTGLGPRLLETALAFADTVGAETVFLETFAGLDPARRLYERAGFSPVSEEVAASWGQSV